MRTGLAAAGAAALSACGRRAQGTLASVTPDPTRTDIPATTAVDTATPDPTQTNTAAASQTPTIVPSTPGSTPVPEEVVLVEAGRFMMGSEEGYDNERPIHEVMISRPFFIGVYPVTHAQYKRFRRADDFGWGGHNHPIANASWKDAVEYANWLSKKERLTPCYSGKSYNTLCDFSASGYRLPTEAEWEYAARGGPLSQGFIYAGSDNPDEVAWYAENAGDKTRPVGLKQPNELGLYDMSGNMFELVWDWYEADYYTIARRENPTGPEKGSNKARRSGNYKESAIIVRTAFRSYDEINYPMNGFRLVRTAV